MCCRGAQRNPLRSPDRIGARHRSPIWVLSCRVTATRARHPDAKGVNTVLHRSLADDHWEPQHQWGSAASEDRVLPPRANTLAILQTVFVTGTAATSHTRSATSSGRAVRLCHGARSE